MAPTLSAVTEASRDPANEPTMVRLDEIEDRGMIQDIATITTTTTSTSAITGAPSTPTKTRSLLPSGSMVDPIAQENEDWSQSTPQSDGLGVKEHIVIFEGGYTDDHKDPDGDTIQPTPISFSSSFHITHSAAVIDDKECLVAQLEIVSPKLDPPAKELSSRKSLSLPPLQTSPTAVPAKKTTPATAIEAATIDSEDPYYSTSVAPISATTSPTSLTVPNSASVFNLQLSHFGPSSEQGSHLGFVESPYPSPTPAASPIDYFSTSWILPPIPSFSEMGLAFDKSRLSSSNGISKREAAEHAQGHRGNEDSPIQHQHSHSTRTIDKSHCSGMDRQIAGTNSGEQQQQQQQREIVPDYDPSVFDQIQSDENEAYILWSTTPESGSGGVVVSASIIETSPPVHLPRHRSGAILSSSASQQTSQQSIPIPEPSSSTPSTVKRWSAGESVKAKNQGRNSLDIDRVRAQTPTATTPSQETSSMAQSNSAQAPSDAFSGSSQPSSPSLTKPPERISGPISMGKQSVLTGPSASSKANVRSATSLGPLSPPFSRSTASQESRVIMAATIEKLVEKLTSDIDYTFLTDFFLIYRLFISPPALLRLLMARFHWALTEDTPQRQIVRVRTFVVLRHWLLNYFEYDFMGFRLLRRTLIQNLKLLNIHPIISSSVRDQRIVQELRRLFQLKRKQYSHTAAQRSLEGSTARRDISIRSLQQDDVDYNGVERSSLEEPLSEGESSDEDSELYSTDSQSDDDDDDEEEVMYEEVSSYIIDEGHSQRDTPPSDNDKENSDLDDGTYNGDRHRLSGSTSSKGRLPSPSYSAGSSQSNDVSSEPFTSSHTHHVSVSGNTTNSAVDATGKMQPRPRTSESSDNSSHHHHHRSHTVPHFHETRPTPRPRPLSYVAPSVDSSLAFSPPESPLPMEAYSANRPLHPSRESSADKKKTFSQYMAATVGQLSKVKRVFKPKSSQSIQDLRNAAYSSTSPQPFVLRGAAVDRDIPKFGSMKATGPTRVISSSEGYAGAREDRDGFEQEGTERSGRWSSDEDDDVRSESTRKSSSERTHSCGRNHHADHSRQFSAAQDRNHGGLWIAAAATPTGGMASEYGDSTMDEGEQRLSTPASPRASDAMSEEQELVLDQRSSGHGPIPVEWDQLLSSIMSPSNSRALRRTTPKRDNRASWMTFSSTSSSVFGAVLSQGHMPPSQAIRDRGESQNVDRFVERTFGPTPPPVVPSGEHRPAYQSVTRPRSIEAIHEQHVRQGSAKMMMSGDSGAGSTALNSGGLTGENTVQMTSPRMSGGRRSHTVAQHPHRQTVPIMHHHYHHHYLQHRQSLQEYQSQRRHSTDVQALRGWSTSTNPSDKRHSTEFNGGTTQRLLEGEAYTAALQETQRQLKLLISQNQDSQRTAPSPPSVTVPPHSQTSRALNGPRNPDFAVSNHHRISVGGSPEPGRPYSGPNWRHLSDPDVSPLVVKPPSKSTPTSTGTAQRGVHRIHTPWYHPSHGPQQNRSHYENSYSQQRSPMNPRFQSIISSSSTVREYVRSPTSIVLRYRSEAIAQQMCLIEREQLNDIQWFELVNAGWKKKSPEADAGSKAPAPPLSDEQQDGDAVAEGRRSTITASGRTASGSLHERPHQSSDSPSVVRLVNRFNLTCQWVTSEILKTSDLETRVKVIEKFIRIAHTCYSYHNFSSLTQVMLGLQAHEVSRLSRTWARVRSQEAKMMEDLVEFTSPFHNWKHLRNAMKTMADEWGGAATGQDPLPASVAVALSPPGSGKRQNKDGGGLFSKIALSSKDRDKQKDQTMHYQQQLQQQQQQQYSSNQGGKGSSTLTGQSSSHTKSFSGPVFPSLVSTLSSKDKDKDSSKNASPCQQPLGGCIPFLGVYLSDLLFNTELPSYVEPKVMIMDAHPDPHAVEYLSTALPTPPQGTSDSSSQRPVFDTRTSSYSSSTFAPTASADLDTPAVTSSNTSTAAAAAAAVDTDAFPTPTSLPTSSPSLTSSSSTSQPPVLLPLSSVPVPAQSMPWMINMHKHRTIATIIRRILTFQKMAGRYPFLRDPEVYQALLSIESTELSDIERERLSDLCEERVSSPSFTSPVFSR
ncbi:hypothetical protein BGX29_007489 [Mortierella sp. GBA35]|nr:hypothetical protein BGX29_007489 [Mortierella sp. GBA35]